MATKLVWTSDPEEAKRLRESGKLDTPTDAEPTKQTNGHYVDIWVE